MSKLSYVLKRIKNMDYSGFLRAIKEVHERSGKPRFLIFFDTIFCGFKYQAGYMDYQLFEMYKMNSKERKTIITRGVNNDIMKKYNNPEYFKYFKNKVLFNEKFREYLNREWMYLTDDSFENFKMFIKNKKSIIVKPTSGTCGKGVQKIDLSLHDEKKLFDRLIKENIKLVEEVATQCSEISALHPNSINTIRVVTLKGKVVVALLRMGNRGNVVDNFNHGGLAAPIDIESGMIKYPAVDKRHNVYKTHPYTHESIVNFVVPRWDEIVTFVEKASKVVPEIGYVGWDVCVGGDRLSLIEGNEFPGHDLYQLPAHRDGNTGLLPIFEKVMEEDK